MSDQEQQEQGNDVETQIETPGGTEVTETPAESPSEGDGGEQTESE